MIYQYANLDIENLPWDRLVTFYGRATNIPTKVEMLASTNTVIAHEASTYIKNNLEHQDGVIQATPFTVLYIINEYCLGNLQADNFIDIFSFFEKSCEYMISLFEEDEINYEDQIKELQDILKEKLFPPFESEKKDEALWEVYDYGDESLLWHTETKRIIAQFKSDLGIKEC